MNATIYAEALFRAIEGKSEGSAKEIVSRLKQVLVKRGHISLTKKILREFVRVAAQREAKKNAVLLVADKKSQHIWLDTYAKYESEGLLPKNAIRKDEIDESIVSGFKIRTNTLLIDGSSRRTLQELYRNILKNRN